MFSLRIAASTRQIYFNAGPTLFSNRYCSKIEMPKSSLEKPIALPPKKRLAIVTCMDARINPFTQLGLEEGDAHIIRNAGGMAKDALRSIIISQRLLGTREIAIYHHTGCGMITFTGPTLRRMLSDADPGNPAIAYQANKIDFLEFDDVEQSVRDDVLKGTKITGWIHYVETGKAVQVV
ncbi:carbonic anhydrase [Desarmillaria tabescens]|uniref:Carbonic anhydrase n=1 Tax=Armillaria tabescens TaxID=1929756 RepID=A0AA39NGH7_ARMTA|nr:carbonic anhydrase [Desarmillaria tabescens]KAK0465212.1 carbonic anhydrase [Desarmillaria tabescens]